MNNSLDCKVTLSQSIVKEIKTRYDTCATATQDTDQTSIDKEAFHASIMELLETLNLKKHEKISCELMTLMASDKCSFDDVLSVLSPYFSNQLNFGRFNIKPNFPIGLHELSVQLNRFTFKRGIDFNIMIVGRSGLGKSTLVNTIFNCSASFSSNVEKGEENAVCSTSPPIRSIKHIIEEKEIRMRVVVHDTPIFGDLLDNTACNDPIINKIKDLYTSHHQKEINPNRDHVLLDDRIHCIIYVISPNGHCMTELDRRAIASLSQIANVIPIIGRADSLDSEDLKGFHHRIKSELDSNQYPTYPLCRYKVSEESQSEILEFETISNKIPLAIVGANHIDTVNKKAMRKCLVGEFDIMDPKFCDTSILVDILLRKHTINLIHTTDKVFYERHRKSLLRNT